MRTTQPHYLLAFLYGSLLLAALFGAAEGLAAPSSANYSLRQYAFTGGNPNSASPVASSNFELTASSMGGISHASMINATSLHHPGYLVPMAWILAHPDILNIYVAGDRVWLEWAAVTGATGYTVRSSVSMTADFEDDLSGVFSNTVWNAPILSPISFYRIQAHSPQ